MAMRLPVLGFSTSVSLQAELPVLLEQRHGFSQSPLARLLLLSIRHQTDIRLATRWAEGLEILPRFRICHERLLHGARKVDVPFAVFGRCLFAERRRVDLREPCVGHSAFTNHPAQPL